MDAELTAAAADVLDAARAAGVLIATAESCTGGLLSAALTAVPGSSDVFACGFVTYSYPSKTALLSVPQKVLADVGAVSEDVAKLMAAGALARAGAGIAVAITGVAGPGASEAKPEGRVCFGLALAGGAVSAQTVEFGALGRSAVRRAAVLHGLGLLRAGLQTQSA